jgi:hypothetical protein
MWQSWVVFEWWRRRREGRRRETACVICGEWRNTVPIPIRPPKSPREGIIEWLFEEYPPPGSPYFCGEEHMALYFDRVIAEREREFY